MTEGTLFVLTIIIAVDAIIMVFIGYRNCYIPDDQLEKAEMIMDKIDNGLIDDWNDDHVITYKYYLNKDSIDSIALKLAIITTIIFVVINAVDVFIRLKVEGKFGILIGAVAILALIAIAYVISYLLSQLALFYQGIAADNMHAYFDKDIVLMEESRNEIFDEHIRNTRPDW